MKPQSCILIILFNIWTQMYIITAILTQEEFNSAVTSNGYSIPKNDVYRHFAENTGNFSRKEVAMFIAQLILESGGFKFTEQLDCLREQCVGHYVDGYGVAGKSYHGRGYIQLTWPANYKAASEGLGLGERLLRHPELVANDTRIAMLVSIWYWDARVRPLLKGKEDQFGRTTKGINPGECIWVNIIAKLRYRLYLKVAEALTIADKAKENGCYN